MGNQVFTEGEQTRTTIFTFDDNMRLTFSIVSTPEKNAGERKSRIHSLIVDQRESGDGMDAAEMATTEHSLLQASHMMSKYRDFHDGQEDYADQQNE